MQKKHLKCWKFLVFDIDILIKMKLKQKVEFFHNIVKNPKYNNADVSKNM